MKKSLLALAVLGAFAVSAQAQTNVSIGGVIQANIKNYKVDNVTTAGKPSSNELRIDDDYTSRFWLTGTEDLGGGNSALFYIENRFNTDVQSTQGPGGTGAVGNGLGNGDTFVGLKGGWGQVTLGKHSMMYTQGLATELGGNGVSAIPSSMWGTFSILDQLAGTGYITVSRVANSILYKTPNLGGFSGSVGLSTNPASSEGVNTIGAGTAATCTGAGTATIALGTPSAANCTAAGGTVFTPAVAGAYNQNYADGKAYFLQGAYANGPIYVNLAYWNQQVEGRVGSDIRQVRLSGSYAFPFGLKIGAQIDRARADNAATGADNGSRTAWEIPVSYTFGPNTVLFSFTKANDVSNTANTGAKMYTLGYDYALSKRTNVGVFYSKLKNDAGANYQPFLAGTSATGSALAAGEGATQFAVGVKHTF